jgi:hypothetical protein
MHVFPRPLQAGPVADALASLVQNSWLVDYSRIEICKNADGTDVVLGAGAYATVRHCLAQHSTSHQLQRALLMCTDHSYCNMPC